MSQATTLNKPIFFGMLLIAAVLLFVNLGGRDYWSDEIFSLPKLNNPKVVLAQASWDVHPPLFFLKEYYWIEIFGRSETATRAMSALFGFLGLLAAYALAKRMIPRANLNLFTIVLVVSPFYLFYARMNRYYALTGLLCLLTIYLFSRMLEKPNIKRQVLFWMSSLILIYEDYVGFILLFSLTLYYFWHFRSQPNKWLRFLIGIIAVAVLYIPWIDNLLQGAGAGSAPYPEARPERDFNMPHFIIYTIIQSVIRIIYAGYNFILGETVYPWNPLILLGIAGGGILFFSALKTGGQNQNFWLFCLILPFFLYILAAAFYGKVFSAANFALLPSKMFFLQPLLLMFLFRSETAKSVILKAGVGLLLIFNLISLLNYHRGVQFLNPKYVTPWRQIAAQFAQDSGKNDIVVTDESPLLHYLDEYPLKAYGLVGAVEYIESQTPPLSVNLVLRHRGEESIYLEGVKLKQALTEKYGAPEFAGVIKMEGMKKIVWSKIMGREFDYYVEIYTYSVPANSQ